MIDWLTSVQEAQNRERWRKVAGSSGLPPRRLALVREIWTWRESEAARRNCPVKRVLRDDLIVELARRRSTDPKQIRAIRGMERGDLARAIPDLSAAIDRALKLPDADCPRIVRTDNNSQLNLLGQFLSHGAGKYLPRRRGGPQHRGHGIRHAELVAFTLAGKRGERPLLAEGWRAEVVGQVFENLLEGKLSIRIRDPKSDQPLEFEPATGG